MAKDKEGVNRLIAKLALLSDELGNIFPNGKSVVVFSLNDNDFGNVKLQLNDFTPTNQLKIDISGIEFIFLSDVLLNNVEGKI